MKSDSPVRLPDRKFVESHNSASTRSVYPASTGELIGAVQKEIPKKPRRSGAEIQTVIQTTFKRSAVLDADPLSVEVLGNEVIRSNTVYDFAEDDGGFRGPWTALGATSVERGW